MFRHVVAALASAALALLIAALPAGAQAPEPRIALVIGNGAYARGPLQNSLNDAGLVAEALRSIGFDIVDGADLSQPDLVRVMRDFVGKVEATGPGAIAFVYFSGYGFSFEGDNYLAAADARLDRENEIPLDTVRLSDLLRALDGMPAQAKIVAIDAARRLPFGIANARLAPGLSALEAPPGMVIAYATEPGLVFDDGAGPYGPYATAIAEMVRTPGSDIVDDFIRIRERVAQLTEGRQLPWHVSALGAPVVLVPGDVAQVAAAAPAPLRQPRPMADLGADEGYAFAMERDDLPHYVEYVAAYPTSPYAPQIWAVIRARREALAWMRAVDINMPQSYWTYLQRYPNGIYAGDAERRLRRLSAPFAPPPGFAPVEFVGVPPPLPYEPVEIVDFYRAPHRFAPPQQVLIAPQPVYFSRLAPPPPRPAGAARILPVLAPLPAVARVTPGQRISVAPAATPTRPAGPAGPSGPIHPGGPPAAALAPNVAPGVAPSTAPGGPPRPGGPLLRPATPSAVIHAQPPPAVANRPPTTAPATVNRPPPAAIVNRPPPAAVVNRAPPPAVLNRPPPPQPPAVAAARPAAPAKKCTVENGKQVCR
jgi:uncharacterized caspase-like protein